MHSVPPPCVPFQPLRGQLAMPAGGLCGRADRPRRGPLFRHQYLQSVIVGRPASITEGHVRAEIQLVGRGPRCMSASVASPRGPGELRQASGARLWTRQHHRQWPRLSPGVLCGVLHKPAGPQSATHSSLDAEVPAGATFQELPPPPWPPSPVLTFGPGTTCT